MRLAYIDPGAGSMYLQLFFLGAILIGIAALIGTLARRKGHSFWLFFIFAVLIWPIALIVALVVEDKRPKEPAIVGSSSLGSHLDELQKITELRGAGTLSQDEFEVEKMRIMGRGGGQ